MAGDRKCPSCRATILSRYNPDPLCATCMRAVRRSGVRVPAWLWDSEPMREALARVDPGAVVAVLRAASGLSQLDLANLVGGWCQSTVSSIERGSRQTLYDIRELLRFADAVDMPRTALAPLILGHPDATMGRAECDARREESGEADVDRRTFNGMAVGVAAGLAGSAARPALPPARVPDRVDAAHVRHLRACLERLRDQYQNVGGGAVLGQARRQFTRARAMLDEADYTEAIGGQLLTVATELGEVAGWCAYDSEDQPLARRLYTEAGMLADASGDPEVTVHVHVDLAQQSAYLARGSGRRGSGRESLRFAERAAEAVRHEPSSKLHALVALRQGMAHAQLGDERAFRAAITTARRELDRGPHPADPAWAGFVRESEITSVEAQGRARLGDPERAALLHRSGVDDVARSSRDRAHIRALLAGALLSAGDASAALGEGGAVLASFGDGQMTSIRTLKELRPLRAAAADRADAEEFRARFDAAARVLAV